VESPRWSTFDFGGAAFPSGGVHRLKRVLRRGTDRSRWSRL
jgi:hypothetical protein